MALTYPNSDRDGPPSHGRDYSETPLIVTWEITQACELSCDHCRADARSDRHPDELTTIEGKQLLDQIAEFESPQPVLVFSGGDPLERSDLFELLEYAATTGLRTTQAQLTTDPTVMTSGVVPHCFGELAVPNS